MLSKEMPKPGVGTITPDSPEATGDRPYGRWGGIRNAIGRAMAEAVEFRPDIALQRKCIA